MQNNLKFEEIIKRDLDNNIIDSLTTNELSGESILITGAGGSIGSAIATYISKFNDIHLICTDRDENRLHSLSLQLLNSALFNSTTFQILDIRDNVAVENMIKKLKPSIIIHTAALKHLAILERQPREALFTNVIGTLNLLINSNKYGVQKFLNISTDKAAEPVSILGKTKYISELFTAHFRNIYNKKYTNVRFGNVFNSKGSVIETFSHQITNNMTVTLTSKDVKRYFMKIDEASALSIHALHLNLGDTHILELGSPVSLLSVIHNLANFFQREPRIEIVGLREGEKLVETLHAKHEIPRKTDNKYIKYFNLTQNIKNLNNIENIILDDFYALAMIDRILFNDTKN